MAKSNKFVLGVALAVTLGVVGTAAIVIDVFFNAPEFSEMRSSVKVTQQLPRGEKRVRAIGPKAPGWVPASQVSHNLLMAIVASEDTAFFSHEGVDYHELKAALKKDLEERRFARGASTITQQVVKNVYLDRSKTVWRKIREILWARALDKTLTKMQILEFYVNLVEWGPGIYGIREASKHYFFVSPSELTAKQAAFLAMLLPSPVKYHQYFTQRKLTKWAARRVRQILNVMQSMRFIDQGEYQLALAEPLWGDPNSEPALAGEDGASPDLPADDSELKEAPAAAGTTPTTNELSQPKLGEGESAPGQMEGGQEVPQGEPGIIPGEPAAAQPELIPSTEE